jgi:hypothetical protein
MKEHVISFDNWLLENEELEAATLAEKKSLEESDEYKEFFNKKLEKFKVKSPNELDTKTKKEFFDEIEKEWDSEEA